MSAPAIGSPRLRSRPFAVLGAGSGFAMPLVIAAITAGVAVWAVEPWPVGVFQDDGIYAILAKSLAGGEGYRYLNLPGAPAATHYPPGYPLLLALLWRLSPAFPANTAVFVFANVAFLVATALGAWYFGRRRIALSSIAAAATALATVACVPVLMFGVFVLSEPMFMALLVPVLVLAERAADTGTRRDAAIAGVLAGLLAMVRTMGQFVAPALVLILVVRRRWSAALTALAAAVVTMLPWQVWVGLHGADVPGVLLGKYGPYSTWLAGAMTGDGGSFLAHVAARNLAVLHALAWEMLTGAGQLTGPTGIALAAVVSAAALGTLALGARDLARRAPVTLWFLLFYLALTLLWPFEPTRFVWALLPLIGMLAVAGARTVVAWRPAIPYARAGRVAALGLMLLFGAGYVRWNARGFRERVWTVLPKSFTDRATPLVEWARSASHPDDLLATDDDALVYLYSGRRTVPVGTLTPQEYLGGQSQGVATASLETLLREFEPRYVLCGSAPCFVAVTQLMTRDPAPLRHVATLRHGVVFERLAP